MQEPQLVHTHVHINESLVHVAQYKQHSAPNILKGDSRQKQKLGPKTVVVFVPGNPGINGIYHDFFCLLFNELSKQAAKSKDKHANLNSPTIISLAHNNFTGPTGGSNTDFDHRNDAETVVKGDKELEDENLNNGEQVSRNKSTDANISHIKVDKRRQSIDEISTFESFDGEPHHVELQVANKLFILRSLLNIDMDKSKLIFIGHSIGCYVILRLLQDAKLASLTKCIILVHPALENLSTTERGSSISRLLNVKFDWILYPLALLVDKLLPLSVKLAITRWYIPRELVVESSQLVIESICSMSRPSNLTALVEMAKSEFKYVKNLDIDSMIAPHLDKLRLIYANEDGWVNEACRKLLREKFPSLYIEELPTLHAFILKPQVVVDYSAKLALLVANAAIKT